MRRPLLLAALLLAGIVPVATAGELKPFTASYSVTWLGISAGTAEIKLEQLPDGRWSYRQQTMVRSLFHLVAPAELLLPSRSVFHIQGGELIPETYTVGEADAGNPQDQSITFDWANGRVRGVVERKPVDLPTQPGLLDKLSVHVALMNALLSGRTPDRFLMLDGNRIKDYVYSTEGKERLKTDAGEYDTVIFRSSRPGSRNGTWFWCAPELGYLPLKVERRDGSNVQWSMRVQQVTR